MKKTLLVTIDYPPAVGGVAAYWKRVVENLPTGKISVLSQRLLWPWGPFRWWRGVFSVLKEYKRGNFEQIMVGQLLPVGNMVYVLHKFFKIPYFVQVYGMDLLMAKKQGRKFTMAKNILASANHVFTNSVATGKQLQAFDVNDYTVVYPIPELIPVLTEAEKARFRKNNQLEKSQIILTLGRLVPRKGQDMVIQAMNKVTESFPEAVYVIAGDGPDKPRLEKLAAESQGQVIFTGKISEKEKNLWLNIVDLMIMPSRMTGDDMEGFGLVYLEAHSLRKPVIAGNQGGAVEAVKDKETGILVNPENPDEIAEAISELLGDKSKAQVLGQNGFERLKSEFSWQRNLQKMIEKL